MTRMLAAIVATLAVLVASAAWLRSALDGPAASRVAQVRTTDLGDAALSAGRDAAEAALDVIVEYIPPRPGPPDAPGPGAVRRAEVPPRPAPKPRAARAAADAVAVVPRGRRPFVESTAPAAAPATGAGRETPAEGLPPVAAGPAPDSEERVSLIRRLLAVYERVRED